MILRFTWLTYADHDHTVPNLLPAQDFSGAIGVEEVIKFLQEEGNKGGKATAALKVGGGIRGAVEVVENGTSAVVATLYGDLLDGEGNNYSDNSYVTTAVGFDGEALVNIDDDGDGGDGEHGGIKRVPYEYHSRVSPLYAENRAPPSDPGWTIGEARMHPSSPPRPSSPRSPRSPESLQGSPTPKPTPAPPPPPSPPSALATASASTSASASAPLGMLDAARLPDIDAMAAEVIKSRLNNANGDANGGGLGEAKGGGRGHDSPSVTAAVEAALEAAALAAMAMASSDAARIEAMGQRPDASQRAIQRATQRAARRTGAHASTLTPSPTTDGAPSHQRIQDDRDQHQASDDEEDEDSSVLPTSTIQLESPTDSNLRSWLPSSGGGGDDGSGGDAKGGGETKVTRRPTTFASRLAKLAEPTTPISSPERKVGGGGGGGGGVGGGDLVVAGTQSNGGGDLVVAGSPTKSQPVHDGGAIGESDARHRARFLSLLLILHIPLPRLTCSGNLLKILIKSYRLLSPNPRGVRLQSPRSRA